MHCHSSPLFTYRKAPLFFLPRSGHHLCQGLVINYAKTWSSIMLRLGHHLCQGLVIIDDGTFAYLTFFFSKMVWMKSGEEW